MIKTVTTAAQLICLNAYLYEKEKNGNGGDEKKVTRFRLSRKTLCVCSGRKILKTSFLNELQEAMLDLGWVIFQLGDGSFGVVKESRAMAWTRLSSKRLKNSGMTEGSLLAKSDDFVDNLYDAIFPETEDEVEDDE